MTEWQFELCSILYACIRLPPRAHRGLASGDVGEGIFFSIRQWQRITLSLQTTKMACSMS
jgi:hypothetical protein